ncbi:hypothetical protein U0070_008646 [Myodes glareolus]|uniref:Uncharacterized protein n=1 Tax=Myodes glareolus TaxID=447135 RepID=A0AAW0H9L6_MYOGA
MKTQGRISLCKPPGGGTHPFPMLALRLQAIPAYPNSVTAPTTASWVPLCICGYTQDLVLSVETEHTFPLADPAVFMVLFLLLLQPQPKQKPKRQRSQMRDYLLTAGGQLPTQEPDTVGIMRWWFRLRHSLGSQAGTARPGCFAFH